MRPGEHHDVSYVAVTRPVRRHRSLSQKRMGWRIKWLSSYGSDFNYDFRVSFTEDQIACDEAYYNYDMRPIAIDELSGRSVFYKDATGAVFHTYSAYARGGENFLGTYHYLDITPKRRRAVTRRSMAT